MQLVTLDGKNYLKQEKDERPLVKENLISKNQLQAEIDAIEKGIRVKQDEIENDKVLKDGLKEALRLFK